MIYTVYLQIGSFVQTTGTVALLSRLSTPPGLVIASDLASYSIDLKMLFSLMQLLIE